MTQIYDINHDDDVNRQNAEEQVEKKFRKPLYGYAFPPRADVCFEGKCWLIICQYVDWTSHCSTFNPLQVCILRKLVNIKTRWKFSLRGQHPPLMMPLSRCCLFQYSKIILISVLNMQYMSMLCLIVEKFEINFLQLDQTNRGHWYCLSSSLQSKSLCKIEIDSASYDMVYNDMVWAFHGEWSLNSLNRVFTLYGTDTSKQTQFVSICHLWKSSCIKICFRKMLAKTKKGKRTMWDQLWS